MAEPLEHVINVERESLMSRPHLVGDRAKESDTLHILFNFRDLREPRRANIQEYKSLHVSFSDLKHQLSPSNPDSSPAAKYKQLISSCLAGFQAPVPEGQHGYVIQKVFEAVEAAETAEVRVVVHVKVFGYLFRRVRLATSDGGIIREIERARTPAAKSVIEGLKLVTDQMNITENSSCAICLEDLSVNAIAELPCKHRFHMHCISQCLEISHLCPLCRYAMPTKEEECSYTLRVWNS